MPNLRCKDTDCLNILTFYLRLFRPPPPPPPALSKRRETALTNQRQEKGTDKRCTQPTPGAAENTRNDAALPCKATRAFERAHRGCGTQAHQELRRNTSEAGGRAHTRVVSCAMSRAKNVALCKVLTSPRNAKKPRVSISTSCILPRAMHTTYERIACGLRQRNTQS